MSEEQEGKGGKAVGGALVLALLALVACPLGIVVMAVVTIPASKDCGTGGSAVVASGGVRMPFDGSFTVTSPFNPNRVHPVLGIVRPHQGVDLALSPTGGSVLAAKNGKVTTVAHGAPGAGNFIEITHGSGLSTRYLHLASTSVEQGQAVTAGQKIGVEGNTTGAGPSTSTGAHLHFEVKQNGVATDPVPWLKKHGITLPGVQQSGTVAAVTKGKSKGEEPLIADGSDIDEAAEGDASMPAADEKNLRNAKHTKAMSIPPKTMTAYKAAAEKYGLPWQVLAGVGMEETHHGRITATSSAGAMGPMQMTAPTWLDFGTDGDGDGQADITNLEDSVFAAAKKLSSQGDMSTPFGIKEAIHRYNPGAGSSPSTSWYVNDVLHYAHAYAGGKVALGGGGAECSDPSAAADAGGVSATKKCDTPSGSPAETGLKPDALNGLRCGKEQAPWVTTMFGVGERGGATDHDDGQAVDFMIPDYTTTASKTKASSFAAWLQTNAKALNISYIIYNQEIWNISRADEGWRPMEDRGDDTQNHHDHLHVSFK